MECQTCFHVDSCLLPLSLCQMTHDKCHTADHLRVYLCISDRSRDFKQVLVLTSPQWPQQPCFLAKTFQSGKD